MTSTYKRVKYSLLFALYIILCFFLLILRNKYDIVVRTIVIRKNENSTNYQFNISIFEDQYDFERENIVQYEDLELGTPIETKVLERNLNERYRRIYEICEKYNLTENLKRTNFFYSPEYETMYCWIRKVASTSFTKFFGDLRGRRVARNYYREINFLAPQSMEELNRIINDTRVFKFLAVRHPFQRLVSSYRDRIEDNSRFTAQAWIYTPRIFHLTRPELFHSNVTSGNSLQNIFTSHKRLKLIPTFREFVVWLLNESSEKDDVHWYQYHKQCSLCNVKFDYILNLENYTFSDMDYIFKKIRLDERRMNLPKIQLTRGGKSDFSRTCKYFAELSEDLVQRLYERYKIDFEMFDYKYEDYANCTKCSEINS